MDFEGTITFLSNQIQSAHPQYTQQIATMKITLQAALVALSSSFALAYDCGSFVAKNGYQSRHVWLFQDNNCGGGWYEGIPTVNGLCFGKRSATLRVSSLTIR